MKLELLEKNHYYHIYNKGINGCNIFNSNENKTFFLKQLDKYINDKVSFFAYCLMDNHFHFVVRIDEDEKQVTQLFSNFFNSYVKAFNKQNNRTGSLFEKHFKRIRLKNEEYLRSLIVYVHLNPTHHLGLDFEEYKFSSYQAILSSKESKIKKNEVMQL
ncbi:transposase [Flavobacterium macrobrachii]|uniref:Transposase n=2 Tax=Flavobacterium macrobrachii TaxID=591204 RepID=A0ABS2D110_9FLAO|nr:transposase [Flavobacterium macrobrachii]MBM6500901.1 transposase [Flavobacterium macrobrachii]